jgi:hypothetical protein
VSHPHIFKEGSRLEQLRVRYQDGLLHIQVEAMIPKDRMQGAQERLDLLQLFLEEKIGEPLILKFLVIPVEILNFQSPIGIDTTAEASLSEDQIK